MQKDHSWQTWAGCHRLDTRHVTVPAMPLCGAVDEVIGGPITCTAACHSQDMTSEQFGTFLDTIPALKMLTISPHVLASREVRTAAGGKVQVLCSEFLA